MMCDKDLYQAMECSSDSEGVDFEDSLRAVKRGTRQRGSRCGLHTGIKLEVSRQSQSIRHVANLIIAVQKLTRKEFSKSELLDYVMGSVVEECVVLKVQDAMHGETYMFMRGNKEVECCMYDQYQKSLVLNQEALELQAITLQGGSFHHKVRLNLSTYVNPNFPPRQGQPVALSITGTSYYLSCSMAAETPILQLEEVKNAASLKTISNGGDTVRFLFFKRDTGFSMTNFESAMYPGWYISTAEEEREPVEMCTLQASSRLTSFMVQSL